MTTEAPETDNVIDLPVQKDPLPPAPETDEMIAFLQRVGPILLNVQGHAAKADEFAARLHERGIDYREYLGGSVD